MLDLEPLNVKVLNKKIWNWLFIKLVHQRCDPYKMDFVQTLQFFKEALLLKLPTVCWKKKKLFFIYIFIES